MIRLGKVLLLRHLQALRDLSVASIYVCYDLVDGIKQGLAPHTSYIPDFACLLLDLLTSRLAYF